MEVTRNAKIVLKELLENVGCKDYFLDYKHELRHPGNFWESTVEVTFPDGRMFHGIGSGHSKSEADIKSSQAILDLLSENHPDLYVNWEQIENEAQAGDALIKLAMYTSQQLETTHEKSNRLQEIESDKHLARVFDFWKSQCDPDLTVWGNNLSEKRKATYIEALLWRRFNERVLKTDATAHLQILIEALQVPEFLQSFVK